MAGLIRTTHPYGFRCGQWAKLRGTIMLPYGRCGRLCYIAEFPDGVIDWWVVRDRHGRYEFA